MEFIEKSYEFLKTTLNTALDLSSEKTVVIKTLNNLFKEQYVEGATDRLIIATISGGEQGFRHSMSASSFRSGFTLTIQNDDDLSLAEVKTVASFILSNKSFVRRLLVLGFDTLVVRGKHTRSLRLKITDKEDFNEIDVTSPPIKNTIQNPTSFEKKVSRCVVSFLSFAKQCLTVK